MVFFLLLSSSLFFLGEGAVPDFETTLMATIDTWEQSTKESEPGRCASEQIKKDF